MPYIPQSERGKFNDLIDAAAEKCDSIGELTYCLYRLACTYEMGQPNDYASKNEVVGALENTKHEYQEMILGPYEVEKRRRNGDIYDDHSETEGDTPAYRSPALVPAASPGQPGLGSIRAPHTGGAR